MPHFTLIFVHADMEASGIYICTIIIKSKVLFALFLVTYLYYIMQGEEEGKQVRGRTQRNAKEGQTGINLLTFALLIVMCYTVWSKVQYVG